MTVTTSEMMRAIDQLKVNDVVVSQVNDGHHLLMVTAMPDDRLSLVYRGDGWTTQYAVARGARLAAGRGGDLWYTSNDFVTVEYLETFRRDTVGNDRLLHSGR